MKTIHLGESNEMTKPQSPAKKWYPTIRFSDNGVAGVSSFDDDDIGKTITVNATIKLVSIAARTPNKKKFDYEFEVHKIEMPDDLSKQEDALKERQGERAKKRGMA